jgi:hypothetical protein
VDIDNIATNVAFCYYLKKNRLTQNRVARAIGMTEWSISRVVNFTRSLYFTEVNQFCSTFAVDIREFSTQVHRFSENRHALEKISRAIGKQKFVALAVFEMLS